MLGKLRAHVQVCIYTHAHSQARTHARTEMCTHTCVRASTCTHARDMRCPLCSNAHQHHVSVGPSHAPAVPKAVRMFGLTADRFYTAVIGTGFAEDRPVNCNPPPFATNQLFATRGFRSILFWGKLVGEAVPRGPARSNTSRMLAHPTPHHRN